MGRPVVGAGPDGRGATAVRGHLGSAGVAGTAAGGGGYRQRVAGRDRRLRASVVAGRDGDAAGDDDGGRASRTRRPGHHRRCGARGRRYRRSVRRARGARGGAGPAVRGSRARARGGRHHDRNPVVGRHRPGRDHRFRPGGVRPRRPGPVAGRAHRDGRYPVRLPGLRGPPVQVPRRPSRFPGPHVPAAPERGGRGNQEADRASGGQQSGRVADARRRLRAAVTAAPARRAGDQARGGQERSGAARPAAGRSRSRIPGPPG